MIDTDNLRTASLYINNQLLSRGLLRDGQSIDFADPGKENHGDASATMGRIMSVVNDLILRRDRDAEHRESLSTTMRALRSENVKNTNEITKLSEKNTEAQRKVDIAESSELALKKQLKSAEAAMRGLKDEVARTKALVSQARASCATDVRRRDRQIDTLKKQLGEAGRARGSRNSPSITTITVAPGFGGENGSPTRTGSTSAEDYSLRSETNSFLANLAQNLSEENEALLRAMRKAMRQLREMSGWDGSENQDSLATQQPSWEDMSSELDSVLDHMRNILTNPSFVPIEEVMLREEEINHLKDGWVKMEDRWKEAVHLIDGWRKRMATNGRPIGDEELKFGLRLSPIRVKDVEETSQARGFGLSAVAEEPEEQHEHLQPSPCPGPDSGHLLPGHELMEEEEVGLEDGESDSSLYGKNGFEEKDYDAEEPNVEVLQESVASPDDQFQPSPDSSPLPEPPQLSPLRHSNSAGNRGSARNEKQPRKLGGLTTKAAEQSRDVGREPREPHSPPHRIKSAAQPVRPQLTAENPSKKPRSPNRSSLEDALLGKAEDGAGPPDAGDAAAMPQEEESERKGREQGPSTKRQQSPLRGNSRLPLPRNAETASQQSPLTMATIAAKLAASEREADAARVRAKLKAARNARGAIAGKSTDDTPANEAPPESEAAGTDAKAGGVEDVDPVKHDPAALAEDLKVEKRKRDRKGTKTASRRRSTLSPWELESLITGTAQ